jgi:hypothetical protein
LGLIVAIIAIASFAYLRNPEANNNSQMSSMCNGCSKAKSCSVAQQKEIQKETESFCKDSTEIELSTQNIIADE